MVLAVLRTSDWAVVSVRECIGRLWLLLGMETMAFPNAVADGCEALAAKLDIPAAEWQSSVTLTTAVQEGVYTESSEVVKREDAPAAVRSAVLSEVWRLCRNSDNRLALVECGAVRSVCAVVRRRRGDAGIAEAAFRAVTKLGSHT